MKQYEYTISKLMVMSPLFVFIPLAYFGVANTMAHRDVNYKHFLFLTGTSATSFWVLTTIIFLTLALFNFYILVKSFGEPRLVTFDEHTLTAPIKPISNKLLTVRYHDITDYNVNTFANVRQLIINTTQGRIVMADVNFNNPTDFDEIVKMISLKIKT